MSNSVEPIKNNRVEQMKKIHTEALELFTRKNTDYGDAFAKYGVIGVLMRIEDKLQRTMSITKNGINLVNDEGIRDTLIDLHNYSAMAIMLLDEDELKKMTQQLDIIMQYQRLDTETIHPNPPPPTPIQATRPKW